MKRFKPLVCVLAAGIGVCGITVAVLSMADPCHVQQIDIPPTEVDIPAADSGSGGVEDETGAP
jgi:hypothetical protein